MPEGDNIYKHAELLRARLQGKTVTAVHAQGVVFPALVGTTVGVIEARGKHLLVALGDRAQAHLHLGMNGRLRLVAPPTLTRWGAARASLVIATPEVAAVWSQARTAELLRSAFAHTHPALRALGPDVLAENFDEAAVVARARAAPDRPLGEMLLDQRIMAGVGNVYKSEALFLEKLDPWMWVGELESPVLAQLLQRSRTLMQANLGPWRRTTTADLARGQWIPRDQGRYHVYRRTGRPCLVCGTRIAAADQGDPPRTTYFCPGCQNATGRRRT